MRDDFAAFILTHGRPNKVVTYNTLLKCGYTGKIYIIIDNEDKTADEYYKNYGDKVIMFDKKTISENFDEGDNFEDRRAIIYARNASFEIAKNLGLNYFIELDDDYTKFNYMYNSNNEFTHDWIKNIDNIFQIFVKYYESINCDSIAFIQGGDIFGGGICTNLTGSRFPFKKRKCMNSFICSTKRKYNFVGRINEDVNTYCFYGSIGKLFMTIPLISLTQIQTQSNAGGMSDLYLDSGTYIKSFYTVMYQPSSVSVQLMGERHKRLHHRIRWDCTVPQIISEDYKK